MRSRHIAVTTVIKSPTAAEQQIRIVWISPKPLVNDA